MANYTTFATAVPAIVVEYLAAHPVTLPTKAYEVGKDPGQPDLPYPAGDYADHKSELTEDAVVALWNLVPRPSKKEIALALNVQHPELVAIAARKGAKRLGVELNNGRLGKKAPAPTAPAVEAKAPEVVAPETKAPKAPRSPRKPRNTAPKASKSAAA